MSKPSPASEELDELDDYCPECGDYLEDGATCYCQDEGIDEDDFGWEYYQGEKLGLPLPVIDEQITQGMKALE